MGAPKAGVQRAVLRTQGVRQVRLRSPLLLAALLVVAACSLSACAAGSVPPAVAHTASSSTTTSVPVRNPSPTARFAYTEFEFEQCMRAHGVSLGNPPTPSPATPSIGMSYLGNSFNPNSRTYERASAACQKYAVAEPVTPSAAAKVETDQLRYAFCMRARGIANFPDPSANGGFTIPKSIDRNSRRLTAAERACKGYLPILSPPGLPRG
jgi:hypothetical protein